MDLGLWIQILLGLGNRFGNLFIFAFVLTKIKAFRRIVAKEKLSAEDKLILSVVFGIFGIVGTYFSFEYNGALINTRIIGVASGGLLGGPLVGVLSGLIAGVHRGLINAGNVTSTACAVSTIFEGLMAGCMGLYVRNKRIKWPYAMLTGAIAESMRKIALLIMIKPFSVALDLVIDIWVPMVIINSLGLGLFFMILEAIFKDRERAVARQSDLSLKIADRALPYLKKGIDSDEFGKVAKVVYDMTDFDAVTLTDREKIISHEGIGTARHAVGAPVVTFLTERVLARGECVVMGRCEERDCQFIGKCMLKSTLTLPLNDGSEIVGTLKLYKTTEGSITAVDTALGNGLAKLISTELRIAKLEGRSKLVAQAEVRALQAQINPHFLFNSLTVIGSLCRTEPLKARDLIFSLSSFFRKNLNGNRQNVPVWEELEHVRSYVEIERARLKDKLEIVYEVDESLDFMLPSLTLQPLVENAIKHGIYPKKENGEVRIIAEKRGESYLVSISDNGVGMESEYLQTLQKGESFGLESIGFGNVIKRLEGYFGPKFSFDVRSKKNDGTVIELRIPEVRGAAL
ncbi:MAG TPA: LytS/YhcK type 5TM receptor domain-containing protein [Clostridia bacterium]|nr:LytS/YhcK type 5TM receptor domain-containing protein [Clostridia bacterium]